MFDIEFEGYCCRTSFVGSLQLLYWTAVHRQLIRHTTYWIRTFGEVKSELDIPAEALNKLENGRMEEADIESLQGANLSINTVNLYFHTP